MAIACTPTTPRRAALWGPAILLAGLAAAPLAADVKAGVDAWSAGDFTRAVSEWQAPAQNGDADALFNLAQAYRLGRGVAADLERARTLYAEAAQRGHVEAADNYGLMLFQMGEQKKAMPLIRAAAERGDPRAQYILGLSHFNADYAPKDWVRAYALLTLAQSAGLPQAKSALAQMDQHVPLTQRQQAQSLARELEAEANRRRSAELAALDLEQRGAEIGAPVPQAPAPASALVRVPPPGPVTVATSTPASKPAPTPAITPAAPRPLAQPSPRKGNWAVQLGAFGVRANADKLWARLGGQGALSGTTKELVASGKVTRLLARGFESRAAAEAACAALKRQGEACLVSQP